MLLRGAVFVFALLASGCASAFRAPTTPFPNTHSTPPWDMNRELLLPVNDRILFVVELAAGRPPEPRALDHLVRVASRYGERPASWVATGTPSAPRLARDRQGRLHFLDGADPRTSYVLIRYAGRLGGHFGLSQPITAVDRRTTRTIYQIDIAQDTHWDLHALWLTPWRLEMQTLVHEYGHLLGLPSPPHGYYPRYPYLEDGAHCVNPDCPLVVPSLRSILYGAFRIGLTFRFLDDYCADCRRDIDAARRFFRNIL